MPEDINEYINEYTELWRQLTDYLSENNNNGYKVVIFVLSAIVTFVFGITLVVKGKLSYETRNAKKCRKAIERGQTLQAVLIRNTSSQVVKEVTNRENVIMRTHTHWSFSGIYKYTYGGKTYNYRYSGNSQPPSVLTLYYLNNPKRPFCAGPPKKTPILIVYIFPIIIALIVAKLLGVDFSGL